MLWWGGRRVVCMSTVAVVGWVGRWRVIVEWRGEVRDWRRGSITEWVVVVERAAKSWRGGGGVDEKGRAAAERVWCRLVRKCCREANWDRCWRCSTIGFKRA